MTECENLKSCQWVKEYSGSNEVYVEYFVKNYCKGSMQERCVRKKVKAEFGEIPLNMQPNGKPMRGTDESGWKPEISDFLKKI